MLLSKNVNNDVSKDSPNSILMLRFSFVLLKNMLIDHVSGNTLHLMFNVFNSKRFFTCSFHHTLSNDFI